MTGRIKGIIMAVTGATLWGLSGTVAQHLFQSEGFTAGWLVTVRLLFSGIVLILMSNKKSSLMLWKDKGSRIQIIFFSILGMLMVQFTYFSSIELGNAATATFLQYLAPIYVVVFLVLKKRKRPSVWEVLFISSSMMGIFLLVTGGELTTITTSAMAIIWGILSGFALAFYTLYPGKLLRHYGSAIVVGWGMLLAGIAMSVFYPPWILTGQQWQADTLPSILFVSLFGTLLAFYLYLSSLQHIEPTEASLLSSSEPLTAALSTVIWLHVPLSLVELLGGGMIVLTVVGLSFFNQRKKQTFSASQ